MPDTFAPRRRLPSELTLVLLLLVAAATVVGLMLFADAQVGDAQDQELGHDGHDDEVQRALHSAPRAIVAASVTISAAASAARSPA